MDVLDWSCEEYTACRKGAPPAPTSEVTGEDGPQKAGWGLGSSGRGSPSQRAPSTPNTHLAGRGPHPPAPQYFIIQGPGPAVSFFSQVAVSTAVVQSLLHQ